ncbi:ABC-F family ATP-binding cassette domain-containing protein [Levilactobacillus brevis]|jgi:ATPase subunit of ABC transporter with duplicated ATPase domains|uniref:ATPase component of ABC transporter with duplicated ATPase domains n=4 Tax=Lactobacillaceae TaxID=33958 RepID=Q03TA9_LEVBA|nr:ATP-binding cassette domain-containing protein [Levilactobacillus brevis]TYA98202.1 ATP-binding cassette domain-containing protein [Lactobacillus sp. SL9-6]ABJ63563.1 ATPase component of ABC transporter with duplicated ATPase domains [Levilactobacillus brevis ATCC 367]AJA80138.1 heme ABC transporter ATP-binding protein [Levilactobacillus brevis BSO 464]ANN48342.1 ABC-F family ATPase [Levilactobacillus brevis]ARN98405.1 ABC-F family ATPase [Levilactobacillus brevis]
MLTVNNVSMQFSDRKLYDDVNLKFTPGNCYGVIGANGAGKSTFLKIIEGKLKPTSGNVSMGPNERMSSLNQDHFAFEDSIVMDTVIRGHQKLYDIMTEKNAIYMKPDFSDADGIRAAELEAEFGEMGGWEAEAEASQMLQALGIDDSLHNVLMSELTESQKVKVLLGQALFGHPDVLLLDEPTNGLDVQSISWLENFLAGYENTVIVVSHDRHFLNQVCTHMCDVDFGKITLFVGNYDFWMESSELAAQLKANANAKKADQIKQLQEFVARFSANASKSKQATSRKKQLEKITLDDIKPSSRKYPYIKFTPERDLGNDLLRVEHVSKAIDGVTILDDVSFTLRPDEKTAFISRNDLTTTTLMQIIAGDVQPDSGNVVWGQTTSTTYLPKNVNDYFANNDLSVLDWLRQFASKEESDNTFLRGFLGKMLFSGDDVNRAVDVMSGGEKVRAMLSKMMLSKANVLLLDDPTNHLDLESITALNDSLVAFNGAIVFTSHDHEFIQTIANRIIEVSSKGLVDRADTTYDEFLGHEQVQAQVAALYDGE